MGKVAVIGTNSFAGSYFISKLLKEDYEVVGINRSEEKHQIFLPYRRHEEGRFSLHQLDLNKHLEDIVNLFEKEHVTKVINFAALTEIVPSWKNPIHYFNTNTLSTVRLADKLEGMKSLEHFIQVSSPEVYGSYDNATEDCPFNPSSPYASAKAAGDMFIGNLVEHRGFPATILRWTNSYGPGMQLHKMIVRVATFPKMGKKIQLHGGGKAIKSFIHVDDICDGILAIMESEKTGEIYHTGPKIEDENEKGSILSIRDLTEKILEKTGRKFNEWVDIVGERLGQDEKYVINSDKIRRKLGWKPKIGIDDGIQQCIDWVDDNWETIKDMPFEYTHRE